MVCFSSAFLDKYPQNLGVLHHVARALSVSAVIPAPAGLLAAGVASVPLISFEDLAQRENLRRLRSYLLESCDICQNSAARYLSMIRTVLNEARASGLVSGLPADASRLLSVAIFRRHGVYIDNERLHELEALALPSGLRSDALEGLQIARLLFLISARTGARAIDVARLRPTNVRSGRLTYVPQKTKGTSGAFCVVPIGPRTEAMISEVRELLAGVDLSDARAEKSFYVRYERSLKALMKLTDWTEEVTIFEKNEETVKKFCDTVTTHTARHSFATNMYLDEEVGGDIYAIAQMLGHSSVDMTMSYICVPYNERKMAKVKYFE